MYNIGDKVRVSNRIFTIDYSNSSELEPPTKEMKELVGKVGKITKIYTASCGRKEYMLDLLYGEYWLEKELDLFPINKGRIHFVDKCGSSMI